MSWAASSYDENPFSENTMDTSNAKTPLQRTAPLETPQWLQDSVQAAGTPSSSTSAASPNNGEPLDASVPRMILYTRVTNLFLSVSMIVVSLLSLITTQSATTGVLACYVVVFSCLLCCFETHLKQVSKFIALNFGFMFSAKFRTVFMVFVGTILFSISLFGKLIGVLMIINAGANVFILWKYPGYEDAQRIDAQSEIKDYLAANPAFAKSFLDTGLRVGTDIIKNNPDIARQSAEALLSASASRAAQQQQGGYDDRGAYAQV